MLGIIAGTDASTGSAGTRGAARFGSKLVCCGCGEKMAVGHTPAAELKTVLPRVF